MFDLKKIKFFNILVILILVLVFAGFYQKLGLIEFAELDHADVAKGITEKLNIKNMVTAIYLGPRLFDTFIEAMIVIVTALSMKFLWRKK